MPTAILGFYTAEGFVIAADGLSRDCETGETCDREKKLYLVNDPSHALVYALTGTARINDPKDTRVALDLMVECSKAVTALEKQMPDSILTYAEKIAGRLQQALEDSKNAGRIIGYPSTPDPEQPHQCLIARLFFWGYYNGAAARAIVKIVHRNQSLSRLQPARHAVSWPEIRGSRIFNDLFRETPDPRLAAFWIPAMAKLKAPFTMEPLTVAEARDIAVNYIHACESDAGRRIDPVDAPDIGGRIHIATITRKAGAQWMAGYEPT